jgi:four helix bundle suffix protein
LIVPAAPGDQMTQAARSGVQNIAEGSQASGTSKKTELKLTNVARASLEELRLDYEDFLRQRNLPAFAPDHQCLKRFKDLRCSTIEDVRQWLEQEKNTDEHGRTPTRTDKNQKSDFPPPVLIANAALSLLNLCCYLLDRQIAAQSQDFEKQGGFTERLYRIRQSARKKQND